MFVDQDGVLAEYKVEATVADYLSDGYYLKLKPMPIIEYIKTLSDVYVLSTYMKPQALAEKNEWLDKYFNVPVSHRLIIPYGFSKSAYIEELLHRSLTINDILLDDYTKNCIEWQQAGGLAIKWLNGINGLNGKYTGPRVSSIEELDNILRR